MITLVTLVLLAKNGKRLCSRNGLLALVMQIYSMGFPEKPLKDLYFPMKVRNEDGTDEGQTVEVTFYDYFTKHRKLELNTFAYMPYVDVGRPKKPNYIPPETTHAR